jgi:activator of 2-hydroxyglutaryl-CoA dehydratase
LTQRTLRRTRIEARFGGLKVMLPQEPMIVGAVGAALFALDRARKQGEEAAQANN